MRLIYTKSEIMLNVFLIELKDSDELLRDRTRQPYVFGRIDGNKYFTLAERLGTLSHSF